MSADWPMTDLEQLGALRAFDALQGLLLLSPLETYSRDELVQLIERLRRETCEPEAIEAYELATSEAAA